MLVGAAALAALRHRGYHRLRPYATTRNWLLVAERARRPVLIKVSSSVARHSAELAALELLAVAAPSLSIAPCDVIPPNITVFPILRDAQVLSGGMHPNYTLGGPLERFSGERAEKVAALIDCCHGVQVARDMPNGQMQLAGRRCSKLVHGDLRPHNVLIAGGRYQLIDWECSGAGDPHRDVAMLLVSLDLPGNCVSPKYAAHWYQHFVTRPGASIDRLSANVRRILVQLLRHPRLARDAALLLEAAKQPAGRAERPLVAMLAGAR